MNKIAAVLEWIQSHTNVFVTVLAIIWVQSIFLGALVFAEDSTTETQFDANKIYQEGQDSNCAVTGDCGGNIGALDQNRTTATLIRTSTWLGGACIFKDACDRIDSMHLSPGLKNGLLASVDGAITAMVYETPKIDIPKHLAGQWIPGAHTEYSTTSAYAAQDDGMNLLRVTGVEPIWEIMRNIAYAAFVIVIIAAGFMIMFRSKIGGQMSVNIMNTIPNVIVGLILVTFSFAIAGFILDLGRLFTLMIGNYLSGALHAANPSFEVIYFGGPIEMTRSAFGDIFKTAPGISVGGTAGPLGLGGIAAAVLALLGAAAAALPAALIGAAIALLVFIVIAAIALFAGFRLFFTLVTLYLRIILDLILGPLYILMGSLPGKQGSIMAWLKRLLSNSISYPFIFFMLNVVRFLGYSIGNNTGVHTQTVIDFMNGSAVSSNTGTALNVFIVIFGYYLAAGAPDIVKDIMQVEDSKGIGSAMQGAQKTASRIPFIGGAFA